MPFMVIRLPNNYCTTIIVYMIVSETDSNLTKFSVNWFAIAGRRAVVESGLVGDLY